MFFCKLCFLQVAFFLQVGDYTESGELPTMTCPSGFGRTHFAGIMKSSHSGLASQHDLETAMVETRPMMITSPVSLPVINE